MCGSSARRRRSGLPSTATCSAPAACADACEQRWEGRRPPIDSRVHTRNVRATARGTRPNVLVVMFDQVTPDALGCYGNPIVHAPTLDALAREGVVFDAAYSNSPLCTPARYCMMTGQLPSATRGYDNAAYLASTVPTFAHYARSAGYRTVLDGKMHFVGPDQLHGFEERRTTDIYPA